MEKYTPQQVFNYRDVYRELQRIAGVLDELDASYIQPWTPTLQDSSRSDGEGQTYNTGTEGWYLRMGNVVMIQGRIRLTSLGTLAAANQAVIAGLPYKARETEDQYGEPSIYCGYAGNLNLGAAGYSVTGWVADTENVCKLALWDGTGGISSLLISELTNTTDLMFNGWYFTEERDT
jgi:hypothetical protein